MKKSILFVILFSAASLTYGQYADTQNISIKTQIHCSHCLDCGSCGANINDHIREGKGILNVEVDPSANLIKVRYDARETNPEKIREAINAAGYDADDKKAPAEAISKLDGCCSSNLLAQTDSIRTTEQYFEFRAQRKGPFSTGYGYNISVNFGQKHLSKDSLDANKIVSKIESLTSTEDVLEFMNAIGWKLVTAYTTSHDHQYIYYYVMKREI